MKKKKKLRFLLPLSLAALIAVAAFSGCNGGENNAPDEVVTKTAATETIAQTIGEGETVFRFEVIDDAENLAVWSVNTDQVTVGAALVEVGLIEGDETAYGLMVTTVNGLTADYNADNAYWAFHIDGEFAMTGVDSTDIDPEKTYAFIYTKS